MGLLLDSGSKKYHVRIEPLKPHGFWDGVGSQLITTVGGHPQELSCEQGCPVDHETVIVTCSTTYCIT